MSASTHSILVVTPNWLGDAVMALPALADVRRHFPSSQLVVAARQGTADLFHMVPGVDRVVSLTWRGQWWRWRTYRHDVARLNEVAADVAILFPSSFASAWLVKRAQIPQVWGYASDFRRRLLTRAAGRPRRSTHQGEFYQHLVRKLGFETGPLTPSVVVSPAVREDARALLLAHGWNGGTSLVALAPGAAYGTAKQWIPSHVVTFITEVTRRGYACVLVGSRSDARTTGTIRAALPADVRNATFDVAGQTSLNVLAGVLALADVCVSNDSGAMHLAAAVGTAVVATFGPTIEAATRPLTPLDGRAIVLTNPVWCRPCMLRECPIDHRCMTGITPRMVLDAVESLRRRDDNVRAVVHR